jgi:hypothetical protein
MAETRTSEKRPLDEVMLAMDVVDTLRHRRELVERELHSDVRDEQFRERIRQIYASQGMDVPDHIIDQGIAALKEERFSYQLAGEGLGRKLAELYVNRGRWLTRLGLALVVVLGAWAAYQFGYKGYRAHQLGSEIAGMNARIEGANEQIQGLLRSAQRGGTAVDEAAAGPPEVVANAVAARASESRQSLRQAAALLASAGETSMQPNLDRSDYPDGVRQAAERVAEQEALLAQARSELDSAQQGLAGIRSLRELAGRAEAQWQDFLASDPPSAVRQLGANFYDRLRAALQAGETAEAEKLLSQFGSIQVLPTQLAAARDAAMAESGEDAATRRAQQLYDSGVGALANGDLDAAQQALQELQQLRERLVQEFNILIVTQPGELSGVWRVPERNPNARNYYLIVEALDRKGNPVSLSVTSEETGAVSTVSRWGLRVSERAFERVRADKQNDGIIQSRQVGAKRRGRLEPEYLIDTTGGAITSW